MGSNQPTHFEVPDWPPYLVHFRPSTLEMLAVEPLPKCRGRILSNVRRLIHLIVNSPKDWDTTPTSACISKAAGTDEKHVHPADDTSQ